MLVQSPKCNNEISNEVKGCPYCRFKIKKKDAVLRESKCWRIIIPFIMLVIASVILVVSKIELYKKYNGDIYDFTAIYPDSFKIASSEKRTDLEDIVLTDEKGAEIIILACKNKYSGIKAVQKDIQTQNNELYREEVSDYTYECSGEGSDGVYFSGVYIINKDDLLLFTLNYPKDNEENYVKIRNKMSKYFKKNNKTKDDTIISGVLGSDVLGSDKSNSNESDEQQGATALFVIEECKRIYVESEGEYIDSDIKVKNETGKKIKCLTLTVQYLNENKDIVYETYPQVQGPIDNKQSITVPSSVEKSLNPYYVRVVKYDYYDANDSELENWYFYEDNNPQDMLLIEERTSKSNIKKEEEYSEKDKIKELVIDEVTSHLKAPGTAVFSDYFDISQKEISTTTYYYVSGYVDSENGFGALLRSNFEVTLKENNGKYEVYKVKFK